MLFAESLSLALPLLWMMSSVSAYIPASPVNSTSNEGGLNVSDASQLHLQWYSNGSYWENVSYQLAGNGSQGISKGALIHFSESTVNNLTAPTLTPWIAMVSCDANATNQSVVDDIFTLARDKGAVAALLYSEHSDGCVINSAYTDPDVFDQVFDIYSTQSVTSARIIEYQFGQYGAANDTLYGSYDSAWLNNSAAIINSTIASHTPVAPGFLFATLQAFNATGNTNDSSSPGGGPGASTNTGGDAPNTGLAMIILYAITGFVSALFCIVIISGAIRAIRHPERYGPRSARHGGGAEQSRARGLTRAILDTFPIVKFGNSTPPENDSARHELGKEALSNVRISNVYSQAGNAEAMEWEIVDGEAAAAAQSDDTARPASPAQPLRRVSKDVHKPDKAQPLASGSRISDQFEMDAPRQAEAGTLRVSISRDANNGEGTSRDAIPLDQDVVPDAIGRETCPICIVDFEEGDDLRLLPCEGKHRFHQQCVDPWLLELSSSCPICRHDFLALETLLSGNSDDVRSISHPLVHGSPSPHGNRFSRYLRFATNRRNNRQHEPDSTDTSASAAPESST